MSTTEALIAQLTAEATATGTAIGNVAKNLVQLFSATSTAIEAGDTALQTKIDAVTEQVTSLTAGLDANTLADLQKIAQIITTDEGLQASITTLQGLIAANQTAISDAQAVEARLSTALTNAGADITALQGLTTAIQSAASALKDRVSVTETRLTAVEGRVNAVEQDFSGLKADLASVSVNAPAAISAGYLEAVGGTVPVVSIGGKSISLDVA
ncbi:MAG: hypothetical protein V4536_08775 [Pseudomonadota bacterium]